MIEIDKNFAEVIRNKLVEKGVESSIVKELLRLLHAEAMKEIRDQDWFLAQCQKTMDVQPIQRIDWQVAACKSCALPPSKLGKR